MTVTRPRYAEGTTVSPERSQAEIAEQLRRYERRAARTSAGRVELGLERPVWVG